MRRAVAVESKVKVTRENVKELINVEKAVNFLIYFRKHNKTREPSKL